MIKNFIPSLILAFLLGGTLSAFAAGPFDKDTHYQFAVPSFIDAVKAGTASVKDQNELNDINTWAQNGKQALPEFLDDLLTISQQLEAQGTPEFIFQKSVFNA